MTKLSEVFPDGYTQDPEDEPEDMGIYEPPTFDPETAIEFPIVIGEDSPTEEGLKQELSKLTPYARFQVIRETYGFSPKSARELDLAMGYNENVDNVGGFAQYLREVQIHQNRSRSEDPSAAVRKITREVEGFATSTDVDNSMLAKLLHELPDGNLDVLASSSKLHDWKHQGTTRRALRLVALENRIRTHKLDDPEIDLSVPAHDEIGQLVSSLRRYEAVTIVQSLFAQHDKRREMWVRALKDSKIHTVARPIAITALENLGTE